MDKYKLEFIDKLIGDKNKKEQIYSNHKNIITNGNRVPLEVSDSMVSEIPEWVIISKDSTFLIPFCGTGSFPISLMKRLLVHHDIDDCLNRIYVCEESRSTMNFFLKNIYKNIYIGSIMDKNELYGDFEKKWNRKFTCVITNPPYNSERGDNNQSVDIYPEFVDKAFELADRYVIMITKSNWMIKPTQKKFREKMINGYNVDKIVHYKNNPFKGTDIKGGVSYFVIDNENTKNTFELNGVTYDRKTALHFLPYDLNKEELIVLNKLLKHKKLNMGNFRPKGYYGIKTNDDRLSNKGDILCHVSEQKGRFKYISKEILLEDKPKNDLDKYKIFTSSSYAPYKIGRLIKSKDELCSSSLVNWIFDNEKERDLFFNYINTKLFRFCVSLINNKIDIGKSSFSIVPHIDFSKLEKLDDENIYKYLNLTDEDIQVIEERCERLELIKNANKGN
jgi:hypothetical protein